MNLKILRLGIMPPGYPRLRKCHAGLALLPAGYSFPFNCDYMGCSMYRKDTGCPYSMQKERPTWEILKYPGYIGLYLEEEV